MLGKYNYKSRKFLCIFLITCLLFVLYCLNITELKIFSIFLKHKIQFNDIDFIVKTEGCRIPYLDPYDDSIKDYISSERPKSCSSAPPIINANDTSLFINEYFLKYYNVRSKKDIYCTYQPFYRIDPKGNESDHDIKYGEKVDFQISVDVNEEFVKVDCYYNKKKFIDYHSFVPIQKSILNTKRKEDNDELNVIIVGLDSLSRLNFHRQLPRTSKYLIEKLRAIEFMGYNKVGDNTFPNLMPMLTGHHFDELTKICWPSYDSKFDNCSFIWQNYSKNGYVTTFSEDFTELGLFNYLKKGFHKQPTDYYWKTFDYTSFMDIGSRWNIVGLGLDIIRCLGNRASYKVLLDYTLKFIRSMRDYKFFGFFWCTSLAHNDYNIPSEGDDEVLRFLKELFVSNILDKSVLIVLSDHGYRYGSITSTNQGHLEERLPFLFVSLPTWFKEKYPSALKNIKSNAVRLTTPFDVHATLNHILNIKKDVTDDDLQKNIVGDDAQGISLFLPIPLNRTCDTAGIPAHFCTCQERVPVDLVDPVVLLAAQYSVKYMNYLLNNYESCSKLELLEITSATLAKSGDHESGSKKSLNDYTVSFKTVPGYGFFDATVRCVHCDETDFQISGTISRLNLYGNQSHCISDFILKLYCYCKDLIDVNR